MVMKGGITSGVVYPLAITELARKYRFRNIGGTSAGAIAASLAAAAEHGRVSAGGGFLRLAELPQVMAHDLVRLFQPSPGGRPAFAVLLACLGPKSKGRKLLGALSAILAGHPVALLGGGAAGALVYLGLLRLFAGRATHWSFLLLAALVLAGGILAAAARFAIGVRKALEENGFGLCSGASAGVRSGVRPLSEWLADTLDRTAGKTDPAVPLTFRDLWGSDPDAAIDARKRRINLEMMTSNLMHGRPQRLPFETRIFHWRPSDFEDLFPARIVTWMLDHSEAVADEEHWDLRKLPDSADLPVVVAARLSLSFPLLLSAVPLYTVDRAQPSNRALEKAGRPPRFEPCWFSDGGLGSNFPVHFFDALLPSRPTFGINLRGFPKEFPRTQVECDNVRFPTKPGQEVLPELRRFAGLGGFLLAIVNLMHNWVDSMQTRLPGYRDRVVHVHIDANEGGLNLDMPAPLVERLSERGWCAGRTLTRDFDWDLHRWVRYRTAMAALQKQLGAMADRFEHDEPTYAEFLATYGPDAAHYHLGNATDALARASALLALSGTWPSKLFRDANVPRPEPELRVMPRT